MAMISREVSDALWRWDPINLADIRDDAPDEYDSLAVLTMEMLDSGASPEVIAQNLAAGIASEWSGAREEDMLVTEQRLLDGAKRFVQECVIDRDRRRQTE